MLKVWYTELYINKEVLTRPILLNFFMKQKIHMHNHSWNEYSNDFDDNDWLLGGFLLIDLKDNCVRIIDAGPCMMVKSSENDITISFSLLEIKPEGMSLEALSNVIERKVQLRFYLLACYMKIQN